MPNNLAKGDYFKEAFEFTIGAPAMQLNKFDGSATEPGSRTRIALDSYNLLLRGCILKNVHEVIAVCAYTGSDTKLVLNSAKF